jgi:hypothetical protein
LLKILPDFTARGPGNAQVPARLSVRGELLDFDATFG